LLERTNWTHDRQSIDDGLVAEFKDRNQVPPKKVGTPSGIFTANFPNIHRPKTPGRFVESVVLPGERAKTRAHQAMVVVFGEMVATRAENRIFNRKNAAYLVGK
jgi:hypothetical protein